MFYRLLRSLFGCSLMLWLVSPSIVPVVAQEAEEVVDIFDLVTDTDSDSVSSNDASSDDDAGTDDDSVFGEMPSDATVSDDEALFTGDDTFSMEDVQPNETDDAAFGDVMNEDDATDETVTIDETVTTDETVNDVFSADAQTDAVTASGAAASSQAASSFEPVDEVPAPATIRATPVTPWRGAQRRNAPGVVKEVVSRAEPKDAVTRYDLTLPELVGQNGDLSWMKDVPLRRELWMLEFRFKPVGIIDVDIPQPSGKVQKRKIWYLVYSVKNTGNVVVPKQGKDLMYSLEPSAKSVRFFPQFIFESTNTNKLYRDQILPIAVDAIQRREGTKFQLLNTVEAVREIAPGEEVSGVVTWDTIDPMTNKFSIYIQGLTNAYIWKQTTRANGGVELTDGKTYRKTLKINFLRRGDQYLIREDQILYGVSGGLDWQWVYR